MVVFGMKLWAVQRRTSCSGSGSGSPDVVPQ
jgi:hypothetical protein